MKPRIKRAMLPRKGAYSVYVNEKCLPYESLHHFTVQEQFQCALWNPSQYVALLTLQQDQLGELARLATGSVFPADHDGRLYCLTKEGLVPALLPFYQCASPQQYQWAKEEALLLTKLRTETDRCCQKEQKPRGLIREDSHFLPREFERWIYYDVDMRFSLPFVIRVPRNSDGQSLPLLIFLHGAGGGGRSCVKPVTASFSMQWALARAGKRGECILLIPSLPTPYQWHTKNYDDNGVHGFPGIWDRLWALLLERYPIEQKQVYLTGISAGGQGCWNQLYLHPDRYAAAIPLMAGDFYPDDEAFARITKTPIWTGHSTNDHIVPVSSTDGMVESVRNAGGQMLRYTRWKRFGHAMFCPFYLHEPWVEWMFSQKKTD